MKSWLWYKYWVSIETKYLGPKFCKDLCVTLPVRPKYMVNWFHKCYENLITDSYLNSKIILFSASVRTFEHCSAWTEQKVSFVSLQLSRNSLTVLRSSSAFFFGVFVLLLFGKWIYMVLAYHNKSCNYSIFQKTKNPSSFNKGRNCNVFAPYHHWCHIWKICHLVPGFSGQIDSTLVISSR